MADLVGYRLGQYRIISKIGEGGIATVYKARQLNINREVAVKVLKETGGSTEFIQRLDREAQTIAQLSHPHIVKLFDYGHQDGKTYLVMELITGGSLAQEIQKGPLPLGTVALVMKQLGAALDHAHRHGIVHRDLKPQNILLDNDGNVLLTDFGLARPTEAGVVITQSGGVMGTPAYMAPEQWNAGDFDPRTDIYALGVILFEMVSGVLPFGGKTLYHMMHMHIFEAPPRLHYLDSKVPLTVDDVVLKALSKDPADRYASAGEMATAFLEAIQTIEGLPMGDLALKAGSLPIVDTRPHLERDLTDVTRDLTIEQPTLAPDPERRRGFLGIFSGIHSAFVVATLLALVLAAVTFTHVPADDRTPTPGPIVIAGADSATSPTPVPPTPSATDTSTATSTTTSTQTATQIDPSPTLTPVLIAGVNVKQSTPGVIAPVKGDIAFVRSGPSLDNAALGGLQRGTRVSVISEAYVQGLLWYLIPLSSGPMAAAWVQAPDVRLLGQTLQDTPSDPPTLMPTMGNPVGSSDDSSGSGGSGSSGTGNGGGSGGSGGNPSPVPPPTNVPPPTHIPPPPPPTKVPPPPPPPTHIPPPPPPTHAPPPPPPTPHH